MRPLHSIVATFGIEHEEPEIVHFSIDDIDAGLMTYGHRFLAPDPISVRRFDDYVAKLEKAKVVLDPARRRDIIRTDAKNLAFAQGFEVIEDEGLLAEVAGLVEWPVVLMGSFEEAFLKIPQEVDPHHHPRQPEMLCGEEGRVTSPTNLSSFRTSKRRTAARRLSPATSASSARAFEMRNSSTRPISRRSCRTV